MANTKQLELIRVIKVMQRQLDLTQLWRIQELLSISITKHTAEVLIDIQYLFLLLDNRQICAVKLCLYYDNLRMNTFNIHIKRSADNPQIRHCTFFSE